MFGHVFEISVYKQRNLNFQIYAATLPHPRLDRMGILDNLITSRKAVIYT